MIAAAQRRQQEAAGGGDRRRILRVPAERRLHPPGVGELVEARDALGGDRLQRAGRDEVDADAVRADVAREVARDGLQRRLADAHPVVDRPGDRRVEVEADDGAAGLAEQRQQVGRQRLEREGARLERRQRALAAASAGSCRRARRAGAKAIACRTPSSRPQRCVSSAATAARSASELTSSSSTSTGSGSRAAARSVSRRARPKLVSTTSAPSCCACSATCQAIESFVITPVISSLRAVEHHDGHRADGSRRSEPASAPASRRHSTSTAIRQTSASVLVADADVAGHQADVVAAAPTARRSRPRQRIVSPKRTGLLEGHVADAAQRDDPRRVERHQADRARQHEHPVRDALAELVRGREDGVGVQRVVVARQAGEEVDVAPRRSCARAS